MTSGQTLWLNPDGEEISCVQAIYLTGTAGSGKSLLTSVLVSWYAKKGAFAAAVNLDPGATSLPYTPDVDIRDYIDLNTLMESYQLGPNGALILAADLLASRIDELQSELDKANPDYAIIDTPGQIELFAYRDSGPFLIKNLRCDNKATIFLFDSLLVSSATNFVSIALLAGSLKLRLEVPQVGVLSKKDLAGNKWKSVLKWSSSVSALEEAISTEHTGNYSLLIGSVLRDLVKLDLGYELIPFSSVTEEGINELSATLSRILTGGEELGD